jgi:hypothetical protein
MNVLKPDLQATVKTLLWKDISQGEVNRKTWVDRKTIRRYARLYNLVAAQEPGPSKSPSASTCPVLISEASARRVTTHHRASATV